MKPADPLTIIEDTREQRGLGRFFSSSVTVVREGLPEGDYSTPELRGLVAIERKSVADLVGSLTHGRERFMREIERLRGYTFRALVVEGTLAEIEAGAYRSRAHPHSMVGSVCSLIADHSLPVIFCGDAKSTAAIVEKLLRRLQAAHAIIPGAQVAS